MEHTTIAVPETLWRRASILLCQYAILQCATDRPVQEIEDTLRVAQRLIRQAEGVDVSLVTGPTPSLVSPNVERVAS